MGQYQDRMVFDFHLFFFPLVVGKSKRKIGVGGYSRLVKLHLPYGDGVRDGVASAALLQFHGLRMTVSIGPTEGRPTQILAR